MNGREKQEKAALVTGGARRIGAAIVEGLHQEGYRIAIHCNRSLEEAQVLAKKCNALRPFSAAVFQADLQEEGAAFQLISEITNWSSHLQVLINNASLFIKSDLENFALREWQALFAVNVQAPFELSSYARPLLKQNRGSIINITDIHAERPLSTYEVYCQTKAALLMQTKALAKSFAPDIRVNAVAPGAIAWPEKDNALTEAACKKIIQATPLQCHGDPAFIAEAVKSLLHNPFITGQVLAVDGGRSIGC